MEYFAYSQKEFHYKYVVMMSDVDQFKHMSFANYLKLMFLASDAMLLSVLHEQEMNECRLVPVETRMQFRNQTAAGDNILIKVNASAIEQGEFALLYTFVLERDAKLVGLGRQQFRHVEGDNGKIKQMPPHMKKALQELQVDEKHLLYRY